MKLFRESFISLVWITTLIITIIIISSCRQDDPEDCLRDQEVIQFIMNKTQHDMEAPGWIVNIDAPAVDHEYAGGKANLESGDDMSSTDLIRIGSITKTFTATLTLILCDEGTLDLNDRLNEYFPEFPGADEIMIRHLLNHTSGITTWDENEEIRMQIFNGTGNWTIEKLIDWGSQQELLSVPGESFHYSNIGYFLLGKIMEQATGKSVAELIQEKICVPLVFTSTFMPDSPQPAGDVIHGYDGSSGAVVDMTGTPAANAINFELAWTAGGMLTTIEELSIWARALVTGQLISDSLHQQQLPLLNPPTPTVPYWSGYGFGLSQTDAWIGHTGAICGYICNMQYYPEKDVSIITFFNKFSAFDVEANASDLSDAGANFMSLARFMCPETLQ